MSDKELEIFNLCERLAELLGDKEAIADLKRLYEKHPEMFKNVQDVADTINEVVSEPEIITNAKREGAILAAKKLEQNHKMGEVAIENDNGTNIVFHANKKRLSEFNKLEKASRLLVETPSAEAAPTWSNRCADNSNELSKCDKAPSTTATNIIPQENKNKIDFQAK
ncbi:hypothetical protein, partial [Helicobacter ganmani]|uniref:hypothetical protein n=2 Tax=Helicobacter TaxID=209 RepID=UPI003A89A5F1